MIGVIEIDAADLGRLVAVREAVSQRERISVAGYLDWRSQAEAMTWFLAVENGRDVGGAHAYLGWHSTPGAGTAVAWTLPAERGRGIGTQLFEQLAEWLGARGCAAMETAVAEDDPASLAWAERHGFRRIGSTSFRTLDLTATKPPSVNLPAGITIAAWADRPGIERQLYAVYCEGAPDIPGEEAAEIAPFERWLASDMRGASDRPEAVFVAFAGDEVVGYAKLSIATDHGGTAWHDLAAVKRDWRGRGIGGALKRAQIAWATEQGFRRLKTRNEQRNIPIARLNETLGYAVEPGEILLRTVLAGPD
jgi:GNAT superfamily N-acetyltransferase